MAAERADVRAAAGVSDGAGALRGGADNRPGETDPAPGRRRRRRVARRNTALRGGPSARVRTGAALLLLVGALGVYLGGRMLMSGLAGLQADLFLENWHERGSMPSERASEVALEAARRASQWYPGAHAEHSQREAHILAWRSFERPVGDPEAEAARREALSAIRASVAARPTWPHGWVDLARAKLELDETDAEFLEALRNALDYGIFRWEIDRDVARIGLLAWDRLPMWHQGRVLEAASRTASHNRGEAAALAPYLEYAGITPAFCTYQRSRQRESHRLCP